MINPKLAASGGKKKGDQKKKKGYNLLEKPVGNGKNTQGPGRPSEPPTQEKPITKFSQKRRTKWPISSSSEPSQNEGRHPKALWQKEDGRLNDISDSKGENRKWPGENVSEKGLVAELLTCLRG